MSASSASRLRVAAVPVESTRGDAPRNVGRVVDALARAAREGIGMAVFPENCLAGYASLSGLHRDELEALAQPLHGDSISAIADAVEVTGVAAGVGLIERAPDGRLFNSYVVCLPGRTRHCHRKLHAFEHRRMSSGEHFTVFDTAWGIRMGVLVGGDAYLIENVRMNALMGATLLIAPHRRYGPDRAMQPVSMQQWRDHDTAAGNGIDWPGSGLPARAADNGMFVVFSDGDAAACADNHAGCAMILDPYGRVLGARAGRKRVTVSAEIDPRLAAASAGRQWLGARRADLYAPLGDTRQRNPVALPETGVIESRGSVALSFAQVKRARG